MEFCAGMPKSLSDWNLKAAKIRIHTPVKLNVCIVFVSETANVEVGTNLTFPSE